MNTDVITIIKDKSISDAAELMDKYKIKIITSTTRSEPWDKN